MGPTEGRSAAASRARAQQRRLNSMGRFSVAPHAMPLKDQGPGADAVVTEAQPPAPQRSSSRWRQWRLQHPAAKAGPASCDVTGPRHHPAEGGSRKRTALGGPSAPARGAPCRGNGTIWAESLVTKQPREGPHLRLYRSQGPIQPPPSRAEAPGWLLRFSHLREWELGEGESLEACPEAMGVCVFRSGYPITKLPSPSDKRDGLYWKVLQGHCPPPPPVQESLHLNEPRI